MIVVKFYRDNKNYIKKYTVEGHANFADYGKDIVCAAVSVLAQTTLLSLVEVCGLKEESLKYEIDDNRGFLNVELPIDIENTVLDRTQIVLETFFLGIKSIIESYPEYVKLENGRCKQ
ncbi:MAG: ribosomal-processing cysteine protease Prp [Tissierellia bacterium]|nr:ribosomal-processing cysteine protease Prp [Tissierellia bacterium]